MKETLTPEEFKKYNASKEGIENEREFYGKDDPMGDRERARYEWARSKVVENKILEIGCSNGYGLRFFKDIPELIYHGLDYNSDIIELAKKEYGDIPGVSFSCGDVNVFPLEQYDTIIAMEVIEHIDNGRELAQELKKHCKKLLITTPYNEPIGMWGHHHKLHGMKESDFSDFSFDYMGMDGRLNEGDKTLMMMEWPVRNDITVEISTKNRVHTTLPLCLMAIAEQTYKPTQIIIYDDSDSPIDLRKITIYTNIFNILDMKGIKWKVLFGQKKGQVFNHEHALQNSNTDYIWRVDDDNYPEPNCLMNLKNTIHIIDNVGAVGGCIWHTDRPVPNKPEFAKNKLTIGIESTPAEWYKFSGIITNAEHLYSSYLYDRIRGIKAGGYSLNSSPACHREETIFSHRLYRAGYRLIIDPNAISYHMKDSQGGIRTHHNHSEYWDYDEKVFRGIMEKEWGIIDIPEKFIALDNGLGDHWAFKSAFSAIRVKFPNHKFLIACCYPQVFLDEKDVIISSIFDATYVAGDTAMQQRNVYKWMAEHNWKESIVEAYKVMYSEI